MDAKVIGMLFNVVYLAGAVLIILLYKRWRSQNSGEDVRLMANLWIGVLFSGVLLFGQLMLGALGTKGATLIPLVIGSVGIIVGLSYYTYERRILVAHIGTGDLSYDRSSNTPLASTVDRSSNSPDVSTIAAVILGFLLTVWAVTNESVELLLWNAIIGLFLGVFLRSVLLVHFVSRLERRLGRQISAWR